MMGRALFCAALLFVSAILPAQTPKTPTRRSVAEENRVLRARVDSLQALLDSLLAPEPSDSAMLSAFEPDTTAATVWSDAQIDSLMGLWHNARSFNMYEEISDLDSVRLSSNVPDSVLIRRLCDINPYITLPFNETVKNYMVMYS